MESVKHVGLRGYVKPYNLTCKFNLDRVAKIYENFLKAELAFADHLLNCW